MYVPSRGASLLYPLTKAIRCILMPMSIMLLFQMDKYTVPLCNPDETALFYTAEIRFAHISTVSLIFR